MEEKQHITIRIANQAPFPLDIPRGDEEMIRKVERDVNHLWETWCRRWPERQPVQVLGMVAFQFARYAYGQESAVAEATRLIGDFERELDALLGQTETPGADR